MKEDANLAISDGDRLLTGYELDGMCEYLPSQYVLDAFFSVSGGKLFDPDSGIRERIDCEVGELESWISDVDINDFHCSFGHVHEGLLGETAKQRNVNLTGTLRECQRCSIAKVRVKFISTTTGTRAVKPGGRVFLGVCGEKSVQLIGGKKYMLIFRDDFTRFNAVYFMRKTRFPDT